MVFAAAATWSSRWHVEFVNISSVNATHFLPYFRTLLHVFSSIDCVVESMGCVSLFIFSHPSSDFVVVFVLCVLSLIMFVRCECYLEPACLPLCSDVKRGQIFEAEAEDKSSRPRPRTIESIDGA